MRFTSKHDGFSLIEVLIAIAIFSIGILAVGAMQIHATASSTQSRKITEALELASRQVEFLRGLPMYDENRDLDGNGVVERFDLPPDLASGEHSISLGAYTIQWRVVDDIPLAAVVNTYTTPPPANVTVSKTITVTAAETGNPGRTLATLELIKVWEQDG